MRGLLLALLLGAVLQSWGQKFPNMVGQLPKINQELPKPWVCPSMPESWSDPYPINRVFPNLDSFLMYLRDKVHQGPVMVSWRTECVYEHGNRPLQYKARNVAEALCQAMATYEVEWVIHNVTVGAALTVRPSCTCCLHK